MISFTYLQQSLIDAQSRVLAAQLADEANPLLDDSKYYSLASSQAWRDWQQVYREWRVLYEEVCFPLTAIGVLYDPSIDFLRDEEDDVPTVKLAAITMVTAKLPILEFPREEKAA